MKTIKKLSVAITIIFGSTAAAKADIPITLYNNLPSNPANISDGLGVTAPTVVANEFSTASSCPQGCTLGNITLNLISVTGDTTGNQLSIFSDNNGAPGSQLFTYNNPASISQIYGNNVFTPAGQFTLQNNTKYWVELSNSGDGVNWDFLNGAKQTALNQPNLAGYDFGLGFTTVNSVHTSLGLLMNVQGMSSVAPAAVPLPAPVWMMGSALIGLIAAKRKKI